MMTTGGFKKGKVNPYQKNGDPNLQQRGTCSPSI